MPPTFLKKEILAQLFSCEFDEISKNTFSYRTPPVAASVYLDLVCVTDKIVTCIFHFQWL